MLSSASATATVTEILGTGTGRSLTARTVRQDQQTVGKGANKGAEHDLVAGVAQEMRSRRGPNWEKAGQHHRNEKDGTRQTVIIDSEETVTVGAFGTTVAKIHDTVATNSGGRRHRARA